MFLLIFIAYTATCHAGLLSLSPDDFQQAGGIKIASIVHNTPSAVSHTSFTRVHNHRPGHSQQTQATQTALIGGLTTQAAAVHQTPAVAGQPIYTTHQWPGVAATIVKPELATVQVVSNAGTATAASKAETPFVESLRHTPAHLTFAARPVVYQILPEIKPVRKISFDEFVPSPRKAKYAH